MSIIGERAAEVAQQLRSQRFRVSTEFALQADIATALTELGIPFDREHRLAPGERIDFFIHRPGIARSADLPGIGIEAKARYGKRSIYRQLERYAGHDAIGALILITGTAMGLPPTINGKPVFFVSLGRCAL